MPQQLRIVLRRWMRSAPEQIVQIEQIDLASNQVRTELAALITPVLLPPQWKGNCHRCLLLRGFWQMHVH